MMQDHKNNKNNLDKISKAKNGSWRCHTEIKTCMTLSHYYSNVYPTILLKELINGSISKDTVKL